MLKCEWSSRSSKVDKEGSIQGLECTILASQNQIVLCQAWQAGLDKFSHILRVSASLVWTSSRSQTFDLYLLSHNKYRLSSREPCLFNFIQLSSCYSTSHTTIIYSLESQVHNHVGHQQRLRRWSTANSNRGQVMPCASCEHDQQA